MSNARIIVARFGGIRSLARVLGHRNPTTVQGWVVRGYIPARRQQEVLVAARTAGVALSPVDFFTSGVAP